VQTCIKLARRSCIAALHVFAHVQWNCNKTKLNGRIRWPSTAFAVYHRAKRGAASCAELAGVHTHCNRLDLQRKNNYCHANFMQVCTNSQRTCILSQAFEHVAGLPWGWYFNPHTHPIPTGIPIGIPMGIPIPTEPELSTLLHVGLPSPIGRFLLFVR